ncbi:hypothetical protein Tco_0651916 [Tanacetum coccineum]|uniref:Uncharacterized protein n=1 Tax=Tanacetum coccineum TaxID=301880 RepID=A0ABQ4WW43_9ASTR
MKNVSYHKLYDILKQHQNEVNEIRVERQARTPNPLALVAQQQPVYYPQPNPTHYTQSSSTRSQAANRNRGKAIGNSPPPTYDQEPEVVVDEEASSKVKEIDKLVALISMSFKKIYKPTNNNLRTSSNTINTNVNNTPITNRGTGFDRQTGHTWMAFGGNTCDLGSFGEETEKITDLHHFHEEVLFTEREDGVAGIKRRRCDLSSDGVRDLATTSGRGRLKEDLESSM